MDYSAYKSVNNWLERLSESSRRTALTVISNYFNWFFNQEGFKGLDPDRLIEMQKESSNKYAQLDALQNYILSCLKGRTQSYKRLVYAYVRSFYMHNRAEFPKDPSSKIRGEKPRTIGRLNL